MSDTFYGQEAVLDGLMPRLVGAKRFSGDWVRREFGTGGPVVRIHGGRVTGKTALIDALHAGYVHQLPLARVDLAAANFGESGLADMTGETANASPVTHLLYLLSYKLGLKVRSLQPRMRFPRLSCGLLLVTAWQLADRRADGGIVPAELQESERQLVAILQQVAPNPRRLNEVLKEWLDALIEYLPAVPGLPGLDTVVRATLSTARGQLLSGRTDRSAKRWWHARLTQYPGTVEQRLFGMIGDFQQRDDGRRLVEEHLVHAFLADIADHGGLLSRAVEAPRPLLLLDNAHAVAGTRLMPLLVGAYQDMAEAAVPSHSAGLPVIVATGLGNGAAHPSCRDVRRGTPWERERDGWLLHLGIQPAGPEDIRTMLSTRRPPGMTGYPPHFSRVVERFSSGRPGCAGLLVEAAAERLRTGGELRAERLPDVPGPDGSTTVADHLLELLLPDPDLRDDLTLLSPALDEQAAGRLWLRLGSHVPEAGTPVADQRLALVTEEVNGAHWDHEAWPWPAEDMPARSARHENRPLIGDRALRTLLLRRLTARSSAEEWGRIHRLLRSDYNANGLGQHAIGHGVAYLHHALALGEVEVVVRCLHHRFAASEPREWLTAVNVICAAPRPPAGFSPAPAMTGLGDCPACATDNGWVVHQAIGQLVRGVWHASDPLSPVPDPDDIALVTTALLTLAMLNDDGVRRAVLRTWPDRLNDGVQPPDLPTTT